MLSFLTFFTFVHSITSSNLLTYNGSGRVPLLRVRHYILQPLVQIRALILRLFNYFFVSSSLIRVLILERNGNGLKKLTIYFENTGELYLQRYS